MSEVAASQSITETQAVEKAQQFIVQNGYTDAPSEKIKPILDRESVEFAESRDSTLKMRFNSLNFDAIGAKKEAKGRNGWSVAFDYKDPRTSRDRHSCRVVTMEEDGSGLRVEHVDGIRDDFVGFSKQRDNRLTKSAE